MKKQMKGLKRTVILVLSAILILAFVPVQTQAQEADQADSVTDIPDTDYVEQTDDTDADIDNTDTKSPDTGSADSDDITDTDDTATDNTDTDNTDTDEGGGENTDQGGQDGENTPGDLPDETMDPVAAPMQMDSSNELYGSLSQFLSLSADRFQIYTVAIIDKNSGKPVQPENAVDVYLEMPSDYDADRTVVSEISMDGQTPVRTELTCTNSNGQVIFATDHAGIYVLMEKKEQKELPPSLDMTSKVEPLELTKKTSDDIQVTSASDTLMNNPQTGDDNSVLIWGVITAAAAAAVAVLIVIFIKRRK